MRQTDTAPSCTARLAWARPEQRHPCFILGACDVWERVAVNSIAHAGNTRWALSESRVVSRVRVAAERVGLLKPRLSRGRVRRGVDPRSAAPDIQTKVVSSISGCVHADVQCSGVQGDISCVGNHLSNECTVHLLDRDGGCGCETRPDPRHSTHLNAIACYASVSESDSVLGGGCESQAKQLNMD
eukprot:2721240-Rhodomonas_salina.1